MRNPRISTVIFSLTVGGFLFSGLLLFLLLGVVWAASPEVLTGTDAGSASNWPCISVETCRIYPFVPCLHLMM